MNEPIEDLYFNWLCAKVMYDEPGRSVDLLKILHGTEFQWLLHGDQNREEDGKALRRHFVRETQLGHPDPALPCSVLEMMIALAVRAEFQTDIPVKDWFWTMMRNLKIDEFRVVRPSDIPYINGALYKLVHRRYDSWGIGGLWPLTRPIQDQREVEIWYQLCAYLEEHGLP